MITLDHISRLQAFDSPARLWAYCVQTGRQIGFEATIYACPPPHKRPTHPDTIIRYRGLSHAEFQRFAIEGLVTEKHLTTRNSLANAKAFRWSDLAILSENKPKFEALKQEANQLGIDDGWIFPVFGPQSRVGLASFGKPQHPGLLEDEAGWKLYAFAEQAHLRLCQLTPDLFTIEKPLSRREMQIVAWAASGKSNAEISLILGLSENSIDSYMRRVFSKLGVHDRTSAAVKAISMDIVRT